MTHIEDFTGTVYVLAYEDYEDLRDCKVVIDEKLAKALVELDIFAYYEEFHFLDYLEARKLAFEQYCDCDGESYCDYPNISDFELQEMIAEKTDGYISWCTDENGNLKNWGVPDE